MIQITFSHHGIEDMHDYQAQLDTNHDFSSQSSIFFFFLVTITANDTMGGDNGPTGHTSTIQVI